MTEQAAARAPLLVVVGPTATGKTELAVLLAERWGAEIISADSVQVYREFEIGTGKPDALQRARAPHHLIDVAAPHEAMDASRWAALAERAIANVELRGRVPVVCGGSFLFVRAWLYGLSGAPGADAAIRERHRMWADRDGRAALHAELARVDPETAARLAPNDFVRVSRALEVYEQSGRPLSDFHADHGFSTPRRDVEFIGIRPTSDEHDAAIAGRARAMFDAGLVDEVRDLVARGHGEARAMGSVGYKQVSLALAEGAPLDVATLLDATVRATRIFARRQRTWLRDEAVRWLSPDEVEAFVADAARYFER